MSQYLSAADIFSFPSRKEADECVAKMFDHHNAVDLSAEYYEVAHVHNVNRRKCLEHEND